MAQRDRAGGRPATRPGRTGRPSGGRPARPAVPGPDLTAQKDRLREVMEPVVIAAGFDLEELTVSRAGRRHLVRVTVDGDTGVSLDDIADISRQVSAALDAAELTGGDFTTGEYTLEVSSPGIDRPLTLPRHWRRSIGRLVSVRVGERQLTGRVLAADADRVLLEVPGGPRELRYAELGAGRVQIEFSRLDEVTDDELGDFDEGTDDLEDFGDAGQPDAADAAEEQEDEE